MSGRFEGTLATIFASVLLMEMPQSSSQTVELILYIFLPTYCFNAVLEKIYINYNNHEKCTQVANGVKPASVCASAKQLGQSNTCCPGKQCLCEADKSRYDSRVGLTCMKNTFGD